MKKMILGLVLLMPFVSNAQIVRILKKAMVLSMPVIHADSMPGTRGAAVVWHPIQNKYYASFAGNEGYPMAVFNSAGKRISDNYLTTMVDVRGMWYNPILKKICGNAYNDHGWFSYKLDAKGIPVENTIDLPGLNQPTEQSVGVFNPKSNQIYFLSGQQISRYNSEGIELEDSLIRIYPGVAKKENIDADDDGTVLSENYNSSALIYTGISNAEFGIVNISQKEVELYSRRTGLRTQRLKFPPDTELYPFFNFSYSNGIYWTFNQDTRKWTGFI